MNWKEFLKPDIKSIVISVILFLVFSILFPGYNLLGFTGFTGGNAGFPFIYEYAAQGKTFFIGIPSYLVIFLDILVLFVLWKFLFVMYKKIRS